MSEKHNRSLSLEILSAYMDGNLSNAEMEKVSSIIAADDTLKDMLETSIEIEDAEASYSDAIFNEESSLKEFSSFSLPSIDEYADGNPEIFALSDILSREEVSLGTDADSIVHKDFNLNISNETIDDSHKDSSNYINVAKIESSMKENVNIGYEPNTSESTFDNFIYQGNQPSCAVRSQEIILRDYGISIPQEELIRFAMENGWYNPDPENGGTPREATGNILDAMGVETQRFDNANIFDIISELRAGHRVIVSVDANELWVKNEPKLYKRLFGEVANRIEDKLDDMAGIQGANHALIVAGVNVNPSDPSDMRVVLIDSGSGDVCIEYKFSAFKKAWDDSHCHMVTTTQPAPFQYNYQTHQMEPSNFESDFMPSMVNLPAGLHNQFELPDTYFDKYGNLEPEYSWNHVVPFWEKWDEENHAQREHLVASSTNSSHEEDDSYTSDELSEEDYTSYENDDDSVDSSSEEDTSSHSYNDEDDTYESESDQMDNGNPSDIDDESDF